MLLISYSTNIAIELSNKRYNEYSYSINISLELSNKKTNILRQGVLTPSITSSSITFIIIVLQYYHILSYCNINTSACYERQIAKGTDRGHFVISTSYWQLKSLCEVTEIWLQKRKKLRPRLSILKIPGCKFDTVAYINALDLSCGFLDLRYRDKSWGNFVPITNTAIEYFSVFLVCSIESK